MASDFKKGYKEFYIPKHKPEIITVPPVNYIAIRSRGNPNEEGGAYQQALGILYAVAYTLEMGYKTDYKMEELFEYVAPPLEGFWWQDNVEGVDYSDRSSLQWISAIQLPDFVMKKDLDWAREAAEKEKKLECSSAESLTVKRGLYVQMMHLDAFDDEPASVVAMGKFIQERGYVDDVNSKRPYREVYMTDARKAAPEKWKTAIRHPIK